MLRRKAWAITWRQGLVAAAVLVLADTAAFAFGARTLSARTASVVRIDGDTAFQRTERRLQRLRASLQQAAQQRGVTLPAFSLLLVEPALWSRFSTGADGVTVAIDTEAPPAGSPVVVTGAAVIAAIAAGRVAPKEAFQRGLIVVDAPAQARADVKALLVAALSDLTERL